MNKKQVLNKMGSLEKHFAVGIKLNAKKRADERNPKNWPKHDVKAHRVGQKVDPHWEMADNPIHTKGHEAYERVHKKMK